MCLQQAWNQLNATTEKYRLAQRIEGHQGPVNCFAIVGDSELLASGGDDERVVIWDLANYKQTQVLSDAAGNWGQITCILWIPLENGVTTHGLLCFGTGRGRVVIYRRQRRRDLLFESSDSQVFSVGESVEAIAFDPVNYRVVTTCHQGKIKMFRLEKEELSLLWTVGQSEGIPRSAHFVNRGEEVIVYTLENGEVTCRDSQTAALKYTKQFKTAIGNIGVDEFQKNVVIDNMSTGFDVYALQRSTPAHSFEVPTGRRYTRDVVFGEKGAVIVGGSDHGKVYVFDLKSSFDLKPSTPAQLITHGKPTSLIQAIITQSSENHHLIISGSSDENSSICIWQKSVCLFPRCISQPSLPGVKTKRALSRRKRKDVNQGETVAVIITLLLVYVILAFTWKSWVPALREELASIHLKAKDLLENPPNNKQRQPMDVENHHAPNKQRQPVDFETLLKLDDRILRRILDVPELTEKSLKALSSGRQAEDKALDNRCPNSAFFEGCLK